MIEIVIFMAVIVFLVWSVWYFVSTYVIKTSVIETSVSTINSSFLSIDYSPAGDIYSKDSLKSDDLWNKLTMTTVFHDVCQINTGIYALNDLDRQVYRLEGNDTFENGATMVTIVPTFCTGLSASLNSVTQLIDGQIVGIDNDGQVYVKSWIDAPFVNVSITTFDDSKIVETTNATGEIVTNTVSTPIVLLSMIDQMQDGTIVGVGRDDKHLYSKDSITSNAEIVDESIELFDVCVTNDNIILGIAVRDHQIYYRTSLAEPWVQQPIEASCCVTRIATYYS